jgi:hypothetical protein
VIFQVLARDGEADLWTKRKEKIIQLIVFMQYPEEMMER